MDTRLIKYSDTGQTTPQDIAFVFNVNINDILFIKENKAGDLRFSLSKLSLQKIADILNDAKIPHQLKENANHSGASYDNPSYIAILSEHRNLFISFINMGKKYAEVSKLLLLQFPSVDRVMRVGYTYVSPRLLRLPAVDECKESTQTYQDLEMSDFLERDTQAQHSKPRSTDEIFLRTAPKSRSVEREKDAENKTSSRSSLG